MIFPLFPKSLKKKCEFDAIKWTIERLNDKDGLGGIFPAMVNSVIALHSVNKIKYKKHQKKKIHFREYVNIYEYMHIAIKHSFSTLRGF